MPDPAVVQPQPSPETWGVGVVPGGPVVVTIASVSGQHVSFLSPDMATAIAAKMTEAAREARTGLVIPPAGTDVAALARNGRQVVQ